MFVRFVYCCQSALWAVSQAGVCTCCFGFLRLRGCGVVVQHCSALQPANEPPPLATPSATTHNPPTQTQQEPGTGIRARMHNLPWATKAAWHTDMHRITYYILHINTFTHTHTRAHTYGNAGQLLNCKVIPLSTQPQIGNL